MKKQYETGILTWAKLEAAVGKLELAPGQNADAFVSPLAFNALVDDLSALDPQSAKFEIEYAKLRAPIYLPDRATVLTVYSSIGVPRDEAWLVPAGFVRQTYVVPTDVIVKSGFQMVGIKYP